MTFGTICLNKPHKTRFLFTVTFFAKRKTMVEKIETQQKGKWENPGVFCIYPFPHNPGLVLTTHRM